VGLTFTVSVMSGKLLPEVITLLLVHLTTGGFERSQVQPDPLAAVAVKPAGNVSIMVTVPLVETGPLFLAVMV